jgi:hypothetical protein
MKSSEVLGAQDIFDILVDLAPHTEIAHHVPGNIKLRLGWAGLSLLDGIDLEAFMHSVPGILETRVRLLSRTVDIDYDPDRLPYELWELVGKLKEEPERADTLRARLEEVFDNGS